MPINPDRSFALSMTEGEVSRSVLIINGPNLNMLGTREPEIYGSKSLADLDALCAAHARTAGLDVECFQSNHEGEIIDRIQAARGRAAAIVINAGAYSHTSLAIADALSAVHLPYYEVHISNVHARERFRHRSTLSAGAKAVICGLGFRGYLAALDHIAETV